LCECYRQGDRVEAEELHLEMSGLVVSDAMMMVMMMMMMMMMGL
jgi:hypothetical protein